MKTYVTAKSQSTPFISGPDQAVHLGHDVITPGPASLAAAQILMNLATCKRARRLCGFAHDALIWRGLFNAFPML